jgi:small-conductance mechanosensitive channel
MVRVRRLLDHPLIDWIAIGIIAGTASASPLVGWFKSVDVVAQRQTMGNTCVVLGVLAAFSTAALFFYAGLDNPSTRRVRERWSGRLAGTFLRALSVIVVSTLVCGFTGLGSPSTGATVVFFIAIIVSVVKLGRLLLVVSALLHGQDYDARLLPELRVREPIDRVPSSVRARGTSRGPAPDQSGK